MTDREKLIELIIQAKIFDPEEALFSEFLADFFLANGVTFAKDTDVSSKWISVEDRLPEKTMKCLVYRTGYGALGGYVDIATYTPCYMGMDGNPMNGKRLWYKYCGEWGGYEAHGVTHWMPMPEPPKEVANECAVLHELCVFR